MTPLQTCTARFTHTQGRVDGGLQGRDVWLVKLAGTDSPEEADALKGCKLLIRPVDRPPLEDEDEFYAQARSPYLTACL